MNSNEDGKLQDLNVELIFISLKTEQGTGQKRDFEILEFKEYWTRRKKKLKTDVTTGLGPEISLLHLLKNAEYLL